MAVDPLTDPERGGSFPRLHRLRRSARMREWLAETRFDSGRTVYPIFVRPGTAPREKLESMPGLFRYSAEDGARHAGEAFEAGVPAVLLFGQSGHKDARGRGAYSPDSAVTKCLRTIKQNWPSLVVLTDVCLCAYTDHGHCGVWSHGAVDNDATLEILQKVAVAHVRAGADFVAPSAMMDHQVGHLRSALDRAGFPGAGILGYSAKFASSFYGPFREAEGSAPTEGDRRGYQLDSRNGREALREIELDIAEGADMVMVKPALPSLDVIARARDRYHVPIAAYQVSGEYAMIKAAADRGWLDARAAAVESLAAIHRAGADVIVTYFALALARWEQELHE
ncbi:MAG: porphobilinogen synthase [Thermoplasmata archaeon]|nr:porphobilinogen synthase [Thermoplasmata archaeon]